MLNVTTIPMTEFALRWRFTDPKYRLLPATHLAQVQPLDAVSSRRLQDTASRWSYETDPANGTFATAARTSIDAYTPDEVCRVRTWLYERGIPLSRRVFLSWNGELAALTTWKMVIRYWDAFWYPSSDDLLVLDASQSWALLLWHEEHAFFASDAARDPGRCSRR